MVTVSTVAVRAQTFTLSDGNARLEIQVSGTGPLLQTLTIDRGPSILGQTGWPSAWGATSIGQPTLERFSMGWNLPNLHQIIFADYSLQGGQAGSGEATLIESLTYYVDPTLHANPKVFQYNDYCLSGPAATSDHAFVQNSGTILQSGTLATLAITADTPPLHYEIGTPEPLFARVSGAKEWFHLADNPGFGVPYPNVPGRVASAFEWQPLLSTGYESTIATVTKRFSMRDAPSAVPEPGSLMLLGMGAAPALALLRRTRRSSKT